MLGFWLFSTVLSWLSSILVCREAVSCSQAAAAACCHSSQPGHSMQSLKSKQPCPTAALGLHKPVPGAMQRVPLEASPISLSAFLLFQLYCSTGHCGSAVIKLTDFWEPSKPEGNLGFLENLISFGVRLYALSILKSQLYFYKNTFLLTSSLLQGKSYWVRWQFLLRWVLRKTHCSIKVN